MPSRNLIDSGFASRRATKLLGTISAMGFLLAIVAVQYAPPLFASEIKLENFRIRGMKIGGPFSLTDQNGNSWSLEKIRGNAAVIFFGYTHCPDVCPTTVSKMVSVLNKLGEKSKGIRMVFISVDPERDTPQILKEYLAYFHDDIVGLTGKLAEVEKVAELYSARFEKAQGSSAAGYFVNHVGFFYILDDQGRVTYVVPHEVGADTMAKGIAKLLTGKKKSSM